MSDSRPMATWASNVQAERERIAQMKKKGAVHTHLIESATDKVFYIVERIWNDNRRDVVPHGWKEGEPDRGEMIDEELAVALAKLGEIILTPTREVEA